MIYKRVPLVNKINALYYYYNNNITILELCKKYNMTKPTFYKAMDLYGPEIKMKITNYIHNNYSESLNGKHNNNYSDSINGSESLNGKHNSHGNEPRIVKTIKQKKKKKMGQQGGNIVNDPIINVSEDIDNIYKNINEINNYKNLKYNI